MECRCPLWARSNLSKRISRRLRAFKVARDLQQDQGIVISGIVALSPFLEAPLLFGNGKFALNAALQLPLLAASELERKLGFG